MSVRYRSSNLLRGRLGRIQTGQPFLQPQDVDGSVRVRSEEMTPVGTERHIPDEGALRSDLDSIEQTSCFNVENGYRPQARGTSQTFSSRIEGHWTDLGEPSILDLPDFSPSPRIPELQQVAFSQGDGRLTVWTQGHKGYSGGP